MKAIIVKVGEKKTSRHGGIYQRVVFKDITEGSKGKQFTFDCYHNHIASARFIPYIALQNMFDNITTVIHNEREVINGCCDFKFLGARHG